MNSAPFAPTIEYFPSDTRNSGPSSPTKVFPPDDTPPYALVEPELFLKEFFILLIIELTVPELLLLLPVSVFAFIVVVIVLGILLIILLIVPQKEFAGCANMVILGFIALTLLAASFAVDSSAVPSPCIDTGLASI